MTSSLSGGRLLSGIAVVALLAGCATGQIESTAGSSSTSSAVATTTTDVSGTSGAVTTTVAATTTHASTTTVGLAGGSLDAPYAVGDPAVSGFTYSDMGTEWDGFVIGLVEAGKGMFADGAGRCLLLLGTLTPTDLGDGAVSSAFSTPTVSLIDRGRLVDSTGGECDASAAQAAGYGWILEAEVTVGTVYPFYVEFFLPGEGSLDLEAVVVGYPSGAEALYYEPTILNTIPIP
jgi:hypothetical protein